MQKTHWIQHVSAQSNKSTQLPHRFFVYGTLRDDLDENASWTADWIRGVSKAWNAKVYGFKMYKCKHLSYPFAIKTNKRKDCISGRVLQWNNEQIFHQKLLEADDIEDYDDAHPEDENNEYIREVVDAKILNQDKIVKAIMYYQKTNVSQLSECDEIPNGNWMDRHLLKQKKRSLL